MGETRKLFHSGSSSLDQCLARAREAFGKSCFGEAEAALREALTFSPYHPGLFNDLGVTLQNQGRADDAAACFGESLRLNPGNPEALVNMGRALQIKEDWPGAMSAYQAVLARLPDNPVALNNLAVCHRMTGELEEALRVLKQLVRKNPSYAAARCNLGMVLQDSGALEEAEACFRQLLRGFPNLVEAHTNLANVLKEQGRLEESLACYQAVLTLAPDLPTVRWNYALALLQSGDYGSGWREFESRWRGCPALMRAKREFVIPQWQGEVGQGGKILLWAEQGLGDTLQFIRYATLVAQTGWTVVVESPTSLVGLLRSVAGVSDVVAAGDPIPEVERHCPLMSLPLCFATEVATIPARTPYLAVDEGSVDIWRARIAAVAQSGGNLQVGLVWAGNPRPHDPVSSLIDKRRSVALKQFSPLLEIPGVTFHSLQKGRPAQQLLAEPELCRKINNWEDELSDFSETAALIGNLDLVISVDTSVAHLAGALNQPVWMLSRFDGCWRWGREGITTPWYPSMRIFRQSKAGGWESVIAQVSTALREMLEERKPA